MVRTNGLADSEGEIHYRALRLIYMFMSLQHQLHNDT